MKICSRCGAQVPENSKFCPACGQVFVPAVTVKKKRVSPVAVLLIIVTALFVLTGAAMGGMLILHPETPADEPALVTETLLEEPEADTMGKAPVQTPSQPEETPAPEVTETPSPEPTEDPDPYGNGFEPRSRNWPGMTFTVAGAEFCTDIDGNDALRIYYELTNTTEETRSYPYGFPQVMQDGEQMTFTYCSGENAVEEAENDDLRIRPGYSLRCAYESTIDPDGGEITVTFYPLEGTGTELTVVFDPQALPGRPAVPCFTPVTDPGWLGSDSTSALVDGVYDVTLESTEFFLRDGFRCLAAYFSFTNNSGETVTLEQACRPGAFQDGVEQNPVYDELHNQWYSPWNAVSAGSSADVVYVWILGSENPVELEGFDAEGNSVLGTLLPVPELLPQ